MTVSSRDTFMLYLAKAWHTMSNMPADTYDEIINMQRYCYDIYADYVPLGVTPKTALADVAGANGLRANMTNFINGCGGRTIAVQTDDWPIMDKTAMLTQYAHAVDTALNPAATMAANGYLHVYPTGSQYTNGGNFTPPAGHVNHSDWRIGLNIEPTSIAAAATALGPVLDAQNNINHIKYLAPGSIDKNDSVIVYMNKAGDYNTVKAAVTGAVAGLDIQDCFAIIWEQFADGQAEASEPPAGSFGSYRTAISVLSYCSTGGRPDLDQFLTAARTIYNTFGVTFDNPHEQGAVTANNAARNWVEELSAY